VVLVVDHIVPVIAGGPSTLDNLITACEPCNQGKGGRSLNEVPPRTDADLLYMEVQQEIAEMRRYQTVLQEREAARAQFMESLRDLWCEASGLSWGPSDQILRPLLLRYSADIVADAVLEVAGKVATGYVNSRKWDRYLYVVARNESQRRYGKEDSDESVDE